jgi:transcriptional regulator with XRE-family HTH domain
MKLTGVFKKERELKGISVADAARNLNISEEAYQQLENGHSAVEKWANVLTNAALILKTPTARLVSENGTAVGITKGSCGKLIKHYRDQRQLSIDEMAAAVGLSIAEYQDLERGQSPLETFGPLLLCFAELIEQPIYNLLFPSGVPIEKLEEYPER